MYDPWTNVGTEVLDKIKMFDSAIVSIRQEILDLKLAQTKMQSIIWIVTLLGSTVAGIIVSFVGRGLL